MEEKSQPLNIACYLDILSRRRWYIIIPFCLVMMIGMFVTTRLPKLYTATTLILIQPQTIPTDYVRPLVTTGIETRIGNISQEIKSRSNLENIINHFRLFAEPEYANMHMEVKITSLRDRIMVDIFKGRQSYASAEAFSVSFKGENPEIVADITNYIAEKFINENTQLREQEGLGTSNFIEDQLNTVRVELEKLEQQLKIFRETHMGGLPEQLDANLRTLDRLQEEHNQKQETLREARKMLVLLNEQIIQTENFQQFPSYSSTGSRVSENDPYVRLQNMKQELEDLKSRYTEFHPDVVKLKVMINSFEEKIIDNKDNKDAKTASSEKTENINIVHVERISSLNQQRNATRFEIEKLESDIQNLTSQTAHYQKLLDETPKRELELISLSRDYQNMKENYASLLEKKLQANLAVNLETTKKSEQFRIIDHAGIPYKPSEPDMKKLFMLILFAGLGLGGGLVFVLEFFDSSVKNVKDLESELDVPVLSSIPRIYSRKDLTYKRVNLVMTTVSIFFAMFLCAGFGLMVLKGVDQTIDMVKRLAG